MNFKVEKFINIVSAQEKENVLEQISEIFFESSNKSFVDQQEKDNFKKKWLELYFSNELSNYVYFIRDKKTVIGYLTGCVDSNSFLLENAFMANQYLSFSTLLEKFPAHLHINLASNSRGRGIGGRLIDRFCLELSNSSIEGAHVITSPVSKNISFYKKNDFNHSVTSSCGNYLFLGRYVNKIG